jgi:hypothetical protein
LRDGGRRVPVARRVEVREGESHQRPASAHHVEAVPSGSWSKICPPVADLLRKRLEHVFK